MLVLLLICASAGCCVAADTISLAGEWGFDPAIAELDIVRAGVVDMPDIYLLEEIGEFEV